MIKTLASKKHTQIFWISSVGALDKKVAKLGDEYHLQFFNQNDVKNGILTELYEYLHAKAMENQEKKKKTEKFIQNFIILDDVVLSKHDQEQLAILLKCYRHLKVTMATAS
jgi:hypothetical protein